MTCGIKPVGTTIVVFPDPVETKTASGIELTSNIKEAERLQMAQVDGIVIAIAEDAFVDLGERNPRCSVGDRIIFSKYAGMMRTGKDEKEYRLIHDKDVLAILK